MTKDDPPTVEDQQDAAPKEVLKEAAVDAEDPTLPTARTKKTTSVNRPYPRRTLEDAFKVATTIRVNNNGNPWPPREVAKSLGMGTGSTFFYLTQASRDFGLTEGTREAANINLTDLGRKAVFPNTPQDLDEAKLEAFNSIEVFRKVVACYGGSNLPGEEYVRNTLQTQFNLDPRVHGNSSNSLRRTVATWGSVRSGRAHRPPPSNLLAGMRPCLHRWIQRPYQSVLQPMVHHPLTGSVPFAL